MRNSTWLMAAVVAAGLTFWGCSETNVTAAKKEAEAPAPAATSAPMAAPAPGAPAGVGYTGTVVETMDAGPYTYVQVDTGSEKIWAAAPQFAVAVGDEVTVPPSTPMVNYQSKTLDRTFEVVYFAGAIYPAGQAPAAPAATAQAPSGHPGGPIAAAKAEVDFSGLQKVEGGNTVGELLGDMAGFSGKTVLVRGKVVKFNQGIMGKNWVHVQDGTGDPGMNDLMVTTDAFAEVGDTVTVEGVPSLDRDFGYGYKFAFIIEDAKLAVE